MAALLLLAGCAKDNPQEDGTDGQTPIRLTSGIEVQSRAHTGMDAQFPAGRGVAFWVDNASTVAQLYGNNILTSDGSNGFTGGTSMFYPTSGDNVDIYALHTNATLADAFPAAAITHTVAANQMAQADYYNSDLLYAANKGVAKTTSAVPMTFYHMLSKVRVAIAPGTTETDLTGATVQIVGTKQWAAFTPSKTADMTSQTARAGMVTATGSAADITLSNAASADFTAGNVTYNDAVVVPQAVASGADFIKITLADNTVLTWQPAAALNLESGKRYTYHVTVTMSGLNVVAAVADWEDSEEPAIQLEANSYMVRPNGNAILIPVSRANKAANPVYNLGADATGLGGVTADNYTVELVWGDTSVGVGGVITALEARTVGGIGYVYVKPGVAGNAVICINVSGVIKWSWHIWVTEPVTWATDNVSALTWMDRNLGAAGTTYDANGKNGLYYQWGRKDAFPGSDGSVNNQTYYTPADPGGTTANLPTGTYTDLPDMVQNPLNFATNNDTYYGSVNQAVDQNDSWGGVSGKKSVYDPCPPGWKMPPIYYSGTNASWGSESDWGAWANTGRIFNGVGGTAGLNHFFPAAGYRTSSTGALYYPGNRGYYWSASSNWAPYGWHLLFYSGRASRLFDARTYGFSVRCVAE